MTCSKMRWPFLAGRQIGADREEHQRTRHQRHDAHHQRQGETVPDGKAVVGRGIAEHRDDGAVQIGTDGAARHNADDQADQHQQKHRQPHEEGRLVRLARKRFGRRAEEHAVDEADRIGHGEGAGDDRRVGRDRIEPRIGMVLDRLGEEHLLGQEAVQQGHARHRRARHHGKRGGDGHGAEQAAEAAHVARSRLVVDDAGGHEQRRLEGGVVHHVEDRRHRAQRAAEAEQHGDKAEMADGRIGQQPFDILLEDREERAQHQRDHAGKTDDEEPFIGSRQHRPHPRHQEDARLDHGCGVQEGRHGGRRRHGVRQPELERELRALGEGAQQDQDQDRPVQIVLAQQVAGCQHLVEIVAAHHMPDQQHAAEQRHAADSGDGQRHARAVARGRIVIPVADQQEGEDAGQLPEDDELDQIAGEHDAKHRSRKGKEEHVETRNRVFRRHVIARVDDNQETDAGDQHREHPGEPVDPEDKLQPQLRHPAHALAHGIAGCNVRIGHHHHDEDGEHDPAGKPGFRIARIGGQQRGDSARHEWQHYHPDESRAAQHAEILWMEMRRYCLISSIMVESTAVPQGLIDANIS
jgi:hypothetical protein